MNPHGDRVEPHWHGHGTGSWAQSGATLLLRGASSWTSWRRSSSAWASACRNCGIGWPGDRGFGIFGGFGSGGRGQASRCTPARDDDPGLRHSLVAVAERRRARYRGTRRADYCVAVLLKVYANCIDGQAGPANQRRQQRDGMTPESLGPAPPRCRPPSAWTASTAASTVGRLPGRKRKLSDRRITGAR